MELVERWEAEVKDCNIQVVGLKALASLSNGLKFFFALHLSCTICIIFLSIWYDCNSKDIRNCCIFGKWLAKDFSVFFTLYISIMWIKFYLSITKRSWCRFLPCLTYIFLAMRIIFPFLLKGEGKRESYFSTNQETGVLWTQLSWRQCLKQEQMNLDTQVKCLKVTIPVESIN